MRGLLPGPFSGRQAPLDRPPPQTPAPCPALGAVPAPQRVSHKGRGCDQSPLRQTLEIPDNFRPVCTCHRRAFFIGDWQASQTSLNTICTVLMMPSCSMRD
jgi:hypothetical protein